MKDDYCNNPCSPDKQTCYVYACCGSRDGGYYTVAFAGQVRYHASLQSSTICVYHKIKSPSASVLCSRTTTLYIYIYIQLDPVMQLLRQLTFDYRTNNPILRGHVKTLIGDSAPLQVCDRVCCVKDSSWLASLP